MAEEVVSHLFFSSSCDIGEVSLRHLFWGGGGIAPQLGPFPPNSQSRKLPIHMQGLEYTYHPNPMFCSCWTTQIPRFWTLQSWRLSPSPTFNSNPVILKCLECCCSLKSHFAVLGLAASNSSATLQIRYGGGVSPIPCFAIFWNAVPTQIPCFTLLGVPKSLQIPCSAMFGLVVSLTLGICQGLRRDSAPLT